MLTCKSPRKVMRVAHALARRCLPRYSSKFSRHDYTCPQLFACLVVREHQRKSYRGIEALLRDCRHWCKRIGMRSVPDHNTLCRAFHALLNGSRVRRLMDRLLQWMALGDALGDALGTTCAIDSTLYDTHHRSRHYEQRCRHYRSSCKRTADARRSRTARRTPKLIISIDTRTHVILAARTRRGMGSDAPDWIPLLRQSTRRLSRLRDALGDALGDAGFDGHENHRFAREVLRVRSWIKASAGRPSDRPPTSRYRRLMRKKLDGSQKGKRYGQRAQVETVNSMMKRNLGDHLRARTPEGRRKEQMLRAITHNIMILLSRQDEG